MAVLFLGLMLFFALVGHSEAIYCLCNGQLSDSVLQKNIDYACGAGADCSPILQNGVCFNPNTVKDHCNYAVNSYYQRSGQLATSCNFSNTAAISQNPPSNAVSGCVYPSSASGSTTPVLSPPGTSTGGNVTPGSTFTPGSGTLAPTGFDNSGGLITRYKGIILTIFLLSASILLSNSMS